MRRVGERRGLVGASLAALVAVLVGTAAPVWACAGLIGSNGAVNPGRTTTLGLSITSRRSSFWAGVGSSASPAAAVAAGVEVVQQVRTDALDLIVLKDGGAAEAEWAHAYGFSLSPAAPEVLDNP